MTLKTESGRDQFERLIEMRDALTKEIDLPRCINCLYRVGESCTIYNAEIPEDHKYDVTKCEKWDSDLPF
jgi:hypothetical protein